LKFINSKVTELLQSTGWPVEYYSMNVLQCVLLHSEQYMFCARSSNSLNNPMFGPEWRWRCVVITTTAQEALFSHVSVCLSVNRITEKTTAQIFIKFCGIVGHGTNSLEFEW